MLKKQNLFWGVLLIILAVAAGIVEAVKKTAQMAGDIFIKGYIVACIILGIIGVTYTVLGIIGFVKPTPEVQQKKKSDTKAMCVVAMFCAVAYALTYVKLPVSFLSLEIKDAVIVLCALIFGPMAGLKIAIIVPFLEMITHSSTGVYGLIMNVLSSATFALVAGLIYKYRRSFYGAIAALVSGVFSVTAIMVLANLFVTPYYMGVPREMVIGLMPTLFLPFNLVKSTLNGAVVLLFYKPFSTVLKRTRLIDYGLADVKKKEGIAARSVIVTLISVAVIAAAICLVLFVIIPMNN